MPRSTSVGLLGQPHRNTNVSVEAEGMNQSSQTVITINKLNLATEPMSNEGLEDRSALAHDGCACPKPLASVMNICRWCFNTFRSVPYDPVGPLSSFETKQSMLNGLFR